MQRAQQAFGHVALGAVALDLRQIDEQRRTRALSEQPVQRAGVADGVQATKGDELEAQESSC